MHYGRLSADRSTKLSQFAEALRALEDTVNWLRKFSEGGERLSTLIDLTLQKERVCETLGAREQQQSIIDELLSLLESAGDKQRLADVLVRQGELRARLGRSQEAEQSLESSLTIAKELSDPLRERNALQAMGFLHWSRGNYDQAISHNNAVLEIDRKRSDTEKIALDLTNLGAVLRSSGDHERSISYLEEAIQIYEAVDNPVRKAYALAILAQTHRDRRDNDTALVVKVEPRRRSSCTQHVPETTGNSRAQIGRRETYDVDVLISDLGEDWSYLVSGRVFGTDGYVQVAEEKRGAVDEPAGVELQRV